jgi:hypothetical protein
LVLAIARADGSNAVQCWAQRVAPQFGRLSALHAQRCPRWSVTPLTQAMPPRTCARYNTTLRVIGVVCISAVSLLCLSSQCLDSTRPATCLHFIRQQALSFVNICGVIITMFLTLHTTCATAVHCTVMPNAACHTESHHICCTTCLSCRAFKPDMHGALFVCTLWIRGNLE